METTNILTPVKVFNPSGFESYCKRRNVKKITFSSSTEEYEHLDLNVEYQKCQASHWCMFPFSIIEMEFTDIEGAYSQYEGCGTLELHGDTCAIMIHGVKKVELYNACDKADMVMIHTCENKEESNTPDRVFLFGLQYE